MQGLQSWPSTTSNLLVGAQKKNKIGDLRNKRWLQITGYGFLLCLVYEEEYFKVRRHL